MPKTRPEILVLFDIDGTLSDSGGAGGRAVAAAFLDTYGRPIDLASIDFRGRTDISLWREMLGQHGMSYEEADGDLRRFQEKYIEHLREMLKQSNPKSMPGCKPLLDRLSSEPQVALGLLTGNIESGGRTKLQAIGLDHYFPVGGFGEDGENRADIARGAIDRAEKFYGITFSREKIHVVGDAEADILAARAVKARSIAVSSGWTKREDLLRLDPDVFMEDLRHVDEFLKAISCQLSAIGGTDSAES